MWLLSKGLSSADSVERTCVTHVCAPCAGADRSATRDGPRGRLARFAVVQRDVTAWSDSADGRRPRDSRGDEVTTSPDGGRRFVIGGWLAYCDVRRLHDESRDRVGDVLATVSTFNLPSPGVTLFYILPGRGVGGWYDPPRHFALIEL